MTGTSSLIRLRPTTFEVRVCSANGLPVTSVTVLSSQMMPKATVRPDWKRHHLTADAP